jgi:hypothetical protein
MWEAQIRRIEVPGQSGQKSLHRPISIEKSWVGGMARACHLTDGGKRKIVVQACLSKKQNPIYKISRAKKGLEAWLK